MHTFAAINPFYAARLTRRLAAPRPEQKRPAVTGEATDSFARELRKPIVIEVRGGVVQDVLNVPPGYEYEIRDYDDLNASESDDAGRAA